LKISTGHDCGQLLPIFIGAGNFYPSASISKKVLSAKEFFSKYKLRLILS
jgi:hypothetical protein